MYWSQPMGAGWWGPARVAPRLCDFRTAAAPFWRTRPPRCGSVDLTLLLPMPCEARFPLGRRGTARSPRHRRATGCKSYNIGATGPARIASKAETSINKPAARRLPAAGGIAFVSAGRVRKRRSAWAKPPAQGPSPQPPPACIPLGQPARTPSARPTIDHQRAGETNLPGRHAGVRAARQPVRLVPQFPPCQRGLAACRRWACLNRRSLREPCESSRRTGRPPGSFLRAGCGGPFQSSSGRRRR